MVTLEETMQYLNNQILPRYDQFDAAHNRSHIMWVDKRSDLISKDFSVDKRLLKISVYMHDIGSAICREYHEIQSAVILIQDPFVRENFCKRDIRIMAEAIEDHRSSSGVRPRNIYGCILADSDRTLDPSMLIKRFIECKIAHYSQENYHKLPEDIYADTLKRCGDGGTLKVWTNNQVVQQELQHLKKILRDKNKFLDLYKSALAEVVGDQMA